MADNYAADHEASKLPYNPPSEEIPQEHVHMSPGRYLATRGSTLKPPMNKAPNPFRLLAMLNRQQWAFFFVGFIAWVSWICTPLVFQDVEREQNHFTKNPITDVTMCDNYRPGMPSISSQSA
jgi:hypothetical protein